MFSSRLPPHTEPNRLTRRLRELRATGVDVLDLTESNPTRAGIPYPADLLAPLAGERGLRYEPQPFGMRQARTAVAEDHRRRGAEVDPDHVVLAASTSEAYTWLFKLLCSPGESVLVPRPSYPLFEHLTRLEGVRAESYDLEYHGRWEIDFGAFDTAPADTRAVLVVSPNNPTGSYVSQADVRRLSAMCQQRGWALIADEVFADYAIDEPAPFTDLATHADTCLTFTLGGFSKQLGLPQVKLAWIVAGGPPVTRGSALEALELVADSFLSVGTPVQVAAAELLVRATPVRAAIQQRVRDNFAALRRIAVDFPASEVLRIEGGWSAVIRVPRTGGEERFALELLETERILVHPGYFFDFPREAYVVVSGLVRRELFGDGITRLLRAAAV